MTSIVRPIQRHRWELAGAALAMVGAVLTVALPPLALPLAAGVLVLLLTLAGAWSPALALAPLILLSEEYGPSLLRESSVLSYDIAHIRLSEGLVLAYAVAVVLKRNRSVTKRRDHLALRHSRSYLRCTAYMLPAFAVALVVGIAVRSNPTELVLSYNEWRGFAAAVLLGALITLDPDVRESPERALFAIMVFCAVRLLTKWALFLAGHGDWHPTLQHVILAWDGADSFIFGILFVTSLWFAILPGTGTPASKSLMGVLAAMAALGVLLSFRRTGFVGMCAALLVTWLAFAKLSLRRLVVPAVCVLGAGGVTSLALVWLAPELASGITDRARSSLLLSYDPTNTFHLLDLYEGLVAVLKHPIVGYGFGSTVPRTLLQHEYDFGIHNLWLHVWFKMGLFGLLTFVLLYFRSMRVAIQSATNTQATSTMRLVGATLLAATASTLAQSLASALVFGSRIPFLYFALLALGTIMLSRPTTTLAGREAAA